MTTFDLYSSLFSQPKILGVDTHIWKEWAYTHRWHVFHGLTNLVGGVVFIAGLVVWLFSSSTSSNAAQPVALPPPEIQVYVSGGVKKPGVYSLQDGQRVSDLLAAAGGVTDLVDQQALAVELNLAIKVKDGEHVHVPLVAERAAQVAQISATTTAGSTLPAPLAEYALTNPTLTSPLTVDTARTGISINTATVTELMDLPQIGEKRANDIIAGRPYATLDELVKKEVITQKMFDAMEAQLAL